MGKDLALGIDLGGTAFKVGLLTAAGKLAASDSFDTPKSKSPKVVLGTLAQQALRVAREYDPAARLVGLGIGIPGPVDPVTGIIKQCPNLHVLDGVNAVEVLGQASGLPTYIGNDAYCATLAELRHGAGRDCANMVLLTLGTGVGGGIALENRVLRGPRQIMGEVGHLIVEPEGPLCGCGNHGCLESLTGRQAIVDAALRGLQAGRSRKLAAKAGANYEHLEPKLIADLARKGDELCVEVMDRVGYYLGLAISDIIVLTDPDLVVLGGGISAAGDVLFDPVRRTVAARSRISDFDPARIVPAQRGNQAGMVGAGALVWEHAG